MTHTLRPTAYIGKAASSGWCNGCTRKLEPDTPVFCLHLRGLQVRFCLTCACETRTLLRERIPQMMRYNLWSSK